MKKKIYYITFGILVLLGACFMLFRFLCGDYYRKPGVDYQTEIELVSYSKSGDEYGGIYFVGLDQGKVTFRQQATAKDKLKKKSRRVSENTYKEIESIVEQYHIKEWTNLENSGEFAYDAAVTSFSIWFSDGLHIDISDECILPQDGWHAVAEIRKIMEKAVGIE